MKLYELPRGSKFRFTPDGEVFKLDHIDGMYSVCFSPDNEIIHIAAFADVEVVDE